MVLLSQLSPSLQDYLEAIWNIIRDKKAVRAKDIARRLGVNNSSVTGALRALSEKQLVNYAPYDVISLTAEGELAAQEVVRRHETLRTFLVDVLAVDETEAEEAACKMEHAVSSSILERFVRYIEFVHLCPRMGPKPMEGFEHYCEHGYTPDQCESCTAACLEEIRRNREEPPQDPEPGLSLDELPMGSLARVTRITGGGPIPKRFEDLGITVGSVVELVRTTPLGDAFQVRARGYLLSLRKDEAVQVRVDPL